MSNPIERTSVEKAVDTVFDLLVEDAPYLARSRSDKMRYAPDPIFLEQLAWNIVTEIFVSVATTLTTTYLHDRLVKHAGEKEKEELESKLVLLRNQLSSAAERLALKEQCIRTLEQTDQLLKSFKASSGIQSIQPDSSRTAQLLESYGWPEPEAKARAALIGPAMMKALSTPGDEDKTGSEHGQ